MTLVTQIKEVLALAAIVVPVVLLGWSTIKKTLGRLSWRAIEHAVVDLDKQMTASGYQPDLIICLGRSGSIVGAMLSQCFNRIVPIVTLSFRYYGDNPKPTPRRRKRLHVEGLIDVCSVRQDLGEVLLLGVDIISGGTVEAALEELKKKNVTPSAVACLFWNPDATVKPRYYHKLCKSRRVYPWERPHLWQAMTSVSSRLAKAGK